MARIRRIEDEWRALLAPEQDRVARRKGAERAFTGAYWASTRRCPGSSRRTD
jgi:peptide-methionine (R)-S-oxide reductase